MANALNLFPVRVPIGRVVDDAGNERDVLMTPEFARALSDLLQRVGGTSGTGTPEIEQLAIDALTKEAFALTPYQPATPQTDPLDGGNAAALAALRAEVADLRAEMSSYAPIMVALQQLENLQVLGGMQDGRVQQQLDDIQVLIGMQDARTGVVKGVATGSRGANVALASLLTALDKSGLVTDQTVI